MIRALLLFLPALASAQEPAWIDLISTVARNPMSEMAQTEQESSWNRFAESPWARGLRQTTPDTEDWLEWHICVDLGPADPWDPAWSLECGIIYQEWLEDQFDTNDYCLDRYLGLRAYNGGRTWILREYSVAETYDRGALEAVCGVPDANGRSRSERSCRENVQYPVSIARREPRYSDYGGRICES